MGVGDSIMGFINQIKKYRTTILRVVGIIVIIVIIGLGVKIAGLNSQLNTTNPLEKNDDELTKKRVAKNDELESATKWLSAIVGIGICATIGWYWYINKGGSTSKHFGYSDYISYIWFGVLIILTIMGIITSWNNILSCHTQQGTCQNSLSDFAKSPLLTTIEQVTILKSYIYIKYKIKNDENNTAICKFSCTDDESVNKIVNQLCQDSTINS